MFSISSRSSSSAELRALQEMSPAASNSGDVVGKMPGAGVKSTGLGRTAARFTSGEEEKKSGGA